MPIVKHKIAKSSARVADGRPLLRETLEAVAAAYSIDRYAAEVNLEHYRGFYPSSELRTYGRVLSLSIEPADENEVFLVAEIEAYDSLMKLWAEGQKRNYSVEILDNFADTGKPYLFGLAVTSTPASLGTHVKQVFSFSFSPTPQEFVMPDPSAGGSATPTAPASPTPPPAAFSAPEGFAQSMQHFSTEIVRLTQARDAAVAELASKTGEFKTQLAAKDTEIADLKNQIPADGYTPRPLQTGSEQNSASATDC